MKKVYRLEGLDCANCAMKIESSITKVSGITDVSVDFAQKKMHVKFDDITIEEAIRKVIKKIEPDVVMEEIQKKASFRTAESLDALTQVTHHKHGGQHVDDNCSCDHQHDENHKHEHHHGAACCSPQKEGLKSSVSDKAHKLYITGLDCASCANKIETHVNKMDGIETTSLNFSTGILYVELHNESDAKRLLTQIMKVVPTLEDGITIKLEKTKSSEKKVSLFSPKENARLYIGIILFVAAILFEEQPYAFWIFLVSYLFAGGKVVLTALKNLFRGQIFDENFLMSIATIGAFFVGSFKEAVAVMIFYEVGEMFQSFAVNRSRKSISSLMNIRADYANKIVDGKEIKVSPEDVTTGDTIIVRAGERVPIDGIIIDGYSALDTSALTGESLPRDAQVDDEVLAGVVNLNGVLTIRVTKPYGESTVSRILELVENASSKKAPMEKFITKFARIYTPIVVGLAIALVVLPMLFIEGAVFQDWLYRALTFLVVSCPCALVISVPLGMFAGIGAASKQGILIKGGNYLEALKNIDTVVFDKTGTLTKGVFRVVECYATQGNQSDLLELAAYGEFHSSHPIAVSIKKAYGKEIDASRLHNYEEVAGNGIHVFDKDDELLLGNYKLMEAYNIAYMNPEKLGTIIHIAKNGNYLGYVIIDDEIKETSKTAIQELKAIGVTKSVMLSGDRQNVGEHVARTLGLDEVHMQLLPVDKVEKVEALLAQETGKHMLAFVGDGINDAPVLARADIGVAMGGIGSDAAIEAADVVLMKDDPRALATAIQIAHKTMKILWQNISFSLGVKVLILGLTIFGLSNMWMGVFADVGVTLLAILNSMRALKVD